MDASELKEPIRSAHNELREDLADADTEAERMFLRGKRAGLLQAIAELSHLCDDGDSSTGRRGIQLRKLDDSTTMIGPDIGGEFDD